MLTFFFKQSRNFASLSSLLTYELLNNLLPCSMSRKKCLRDRPFEVELEVRLGRSRWEQGRLVA